MMPDTVYAFAAHTQGNQSISMSNIAILSEASAAPAPRTKGVERKVKAISSTSALPSKKRASRPPLGKLLASNGESQTRLLSQ